MTITCKQCGIDFERPPKRGGLPRYCSDECRLTAKRAANRESRAARQAAGLCREFGCPSPRVEGRGGYCDECADARLERVAERARARYAADLEKYRERARDRIARLTARSDDEISADLAAVLAESPDGLLPCRAGHRAPAEDFPANRTRRSGRDAYCRSHGSERRARRRSEDWSRRRASWESRGLYGCAYCDAPFEETDHVVARSADGSPGDVDLNTVPSCWRCNRGPGGKFATPVDEWLDRLAAAGDPRGVAREVWESWPRIYLAALEDGTVVDAETGEVVEEGAA